MQSDLFHLFQFHCTKSKELRYNQSHLSNPNLFHGGKAKTQAHATCPLNDDFSSFVLQNTLYKRGINKVAQKVGKEAVELVIEAKDNDPNLFKNEAANLMYHYLILLKAKGFTLEDVEEVLESRKE